MGDHSEEQTSTIPPGQIQRVAIIGGGPAGIAAAKYLLAENVFSNITVYEERSSAGGVWLATPSLPPPHSDQSSPRPSVSPSWPQHSYTIPQPSPPHSPSPIYLHNTTNTWSISSPIYDLLTTNLPKQLMRFTSLPFPDSAPLMPPHQTVKTYLEKYTQSIDERGLVKWGSRVLSVVPLRDERGKRTWEVVSRHVLGTGRNTMIGTYDAVVVANGHYTSPFIPAIPGLLSFSRPSTSDQPRIIHSKSWRHPPPTKQKILIIGAGISGTDIADMIAKSGSQVLLASRTFQPGGSKPPTVTHENIRYVHPVAEFISSPAEAPLKGPTVEVAMPQKKEQHRAVRFKDGTVEEDIDQVIFATGYFYDFPFFSRTGPDCLSSLGVDVRPTSRTGPVNAVLGLWQHLVAREEPTLSFLGLPSKIVPFPVVEVQSAYVARLLAGRLRMPGKEEMVGWETDVIFEKMKDGGTSTGSKNDIRELIEELGKGDAEALTINKRARRYVNSDFHVMQGTDGEYVNELSKLCTDADKEYEVRRGKKAGKAPPYWDERTKWMRRMTGVLQKVMREGKKELIEGVRNVEDVVGTFSHWQEVERRGEGAVEEERMKIERRFGIAAPEHEELEEPE